MSANNRIICFVWVAAMVVMLWNCPGCKDSSGKTPAVSSQPTSRTAAPASMPASIPASAASSQSTAGDQRRIHVFISGKVQGVGFRAFTAECAEGLKLKGFVRNLADGRVELVAEGPAGDIEKLVEKVKYGPSSAHVDGFDLKDETPNSEFKAFVVR